MAKAYFEEVTRVLAIDPGITTGYAVIYPEKKMVLRTGTIMAEDLKDSVLAVPQFLKARKGKMVTVIESTPVYAPSGGEELKAVHTFLQRHFRNAIYVSPGTYLPVMKQTLTKPGISIHEAEAIKLGFYYIKYMMREEKKNE